MKRIEFYGFKVDVGKRLRKVDEEQCERVGVIEDIELYNYKDGIVCKDDGKWFSASWVPTVPDDSIPCEDL